jgi:hypothetical protein
VALMDSQRANHMAQCIGRELVHFLWNGCGLASRGQRIAILIDEHFSDRTEFAMIPNDRAGSAQLHVQ